MGAAFQMAHDARHAPPAVEQLRAAACAGRPRRLDGGDGNSEQ